MRPIYVILIAIWSESNLDAAATPTGALNKASTRRQQ